ncbi:hypothetical protein J6590_049943 [Homalodisca vitripennis]|nr:hypothetical protein J6590_049943 [Homalodisca vitripennis]
MERNGSAEAMEKAHALDEVTFKRSVASINKEHFLLTWLSGYYSSVIWRHSVIKSKNRKQISTSISQQHQDLSGAQEEGVKE